METRRLDMGDRRTRAAVSALLEEAGLSMDNAADYFAGLVDDDERLIGCGGLDGNIIKCLALSPEARGDGMATTLITRLVNEVFESGQTNVRVFTKPEYKALFRSLGFSVCGEGRGAVLLESDSRALERYRRYLAEHRADGVIVANADPVTLGHLHLIERGAAECRRLAVIAVGPDRANTFGYSERLAMLRRAVEHLPNVEVLEGSEYVISHLSFPSYFIKRADDVSRTQAEVDLDIFGRRLAPALGCVRRFVGTEPTDALTAQYNSLMKEILPASGIEVVEVERVAEGDAPVSASRVRRALEGGDLREALELTPRTDIPYLLSRLAVRALRKELDLAPKPGLVDPTDSGSHTDMDHSLMARSIVSLRDYFTRVAVESTDDPSLSPARLVELGLEAEERMLAATGGVNTHRGAIYSLGLAVAATARLLAGHAVGTLSGEIASLARSLPTREAATHGREVRRRHGTPGAAENARGGYAPLFADWLPFYRSTRRDDSDALRLLMRIIGTLDDSNAIHRAGLRKAEEARRKAALLAEGECRPEDLMRLNEEFRLDGISHGGAADMLALVFYIDSVGDALAADRQCTHLHTAPPIPHHINTTP